jgi:hypothetical protein
MGNVCSSSFFNPFQQSFYLSIIRDKPKSKNSSQYKSKFFTRYDVLEERSSARRPTYSTREREVVVTGTNAMSQDTHHTIFLNISINQSRHHVLAGQAKVYLRLPQGRRVSPVSRALGNECLLRTCSDGPSQDFQTHVQTPYGQA